MLSFISLIYKQIIIQLYNWKQCCYYYFEHCYLLDQLKANKILFYLHLFILQYRSESLTCIISSLKNFWHFRMAELLAITFSNFYLYGKVFIYSLILKDNFIRYRTLGGRGLSLSMFKIFSLHSLLFAQFLRRIQM